jgi:hypothetical protein
MPAKHVQSNMYTNQKRLRHKRPREHAKVDSTASAKIGMISLDTSDATRCGEYDP